MLLHQTCALLCRILIFPLVYATEQKGCKNRVLCCSAISGILHRDSAQYIVYKEPQYLGMYIHPPFC
jgi:hypothetical protein